VRRHVDTVHKQAPRYDCPVAFCIRKWTNGFSHEDRLLEHLRVYHHWDIPKKKQVKDDEILIILLRQKIKELEAENAELREKNAELEESNAEFETMNKWLERRVRVLCGVVTDVMRIDDDSFGAPSG